MTDGIGSQRLDMDEEELRRTQSRLHRGPAHGLVRRSRPVHTDKDKLLTGLSILRAHHHGFLLRWLSQCGCCGLDQATAQSNTVVGLWSRRERAARGPTTLSGQPAYGQAGSMEQRLIGRILRLAAAGVAGGIATVVGDHRFSTDANHMRRGPWSRS